jgi:hypothetical protein
MMVVMIIAVSTLAFSPGISGAMAERRVSSVARELIRLGRRARSDSFGYLRAHLIWIVPGDSARVMLLRGPNNSCLLPKWNDIAADCPALPSSGPMAELGARCLENLFVSQISGGKAVSLREEWLDGTVAKYRSDTRALCYAPNGIVYHGTGTLAAAATGLDERNTVNGGFVYALHSGTGDPVSTDRVHRVLFPLGSSARTVR